MISIENLKHFLAAVDNQGILRAADKIFISGSSISRSIQQIESELGKPLFDRVGRMISLNQEGHQFYEKTRELLRQYALLLHEENIDGELRGHYRIGASHFLVEHILSKLISKLADRSKKATFEVYSLDSNLLIKKIANGEVDLGFSFSPKLPEMIDHKRIFKGQLYLCASHSHPLMGKPFHEVRTQLSDYSAIIHRPSDSIDRCDNHPMFKKFKIKPKIRVYWDSDCFALGLLAHGNYWSMLPAFVLETTDKIMPFMHPKEWSAPYEIDMLWNKRKAVTELKDVILNLLETSVGLSN